MDHRESKVEELATTCEAMREEKLPEANLSQSQKMRRIISLLRSETNKGKVKSCGSVNATNVDGSQKRSNTETN